MPKITGWPRCAQATVSRNVTLATVEGPVELAQRWRDGPLIVAFMRHFGCAFCREQLIPAARTSSPGPRHLEPTRWPSSSKEYLGAKVAKGWLRAARSGAVVGISQGDVVLRPATFVVRPGGEIAFAPYNEDSTDNPKVERLLEAVRGAADPGGALSR